MKDKPYLFYVHPRMGWRHYERKLTLGENYMVNKSEAMSGRFSFRYGM